MRALLERTGVELRTSEVSRKELRGDIVAVFWLFAWKLSGYLYSC